MSESLLRFIENVDIGKLLMALSYVLLWKEVRDMRLEVKELRDKQK